VWARRGPRTSVLHVQAVHVGAHLACSEVRHVCCTRAQHIHIHNMIVHNTRVHNMHVYNMQETFICIRMHETFKQNAICVRQTHLKMHGT
jgi:hypothetical protein